MAEERSRLGRGLASLIGDVGGEAAHVERPRAGQRRVPIEFIKASARNPRRSFTDAELSELSASIKEHGVIQPIVVRAIRGQADRYEIIAGERRWRASQRAGLHDVPVVVVDATDAAALEIAIIENVQRADLNPMEEAQGYHALASDFSRSAEDIARIVGKSRSHVANMMRLTKLPGDVQTLLSDGKLTMGHARALISADDASALAKRIVDEGLNVRQVEALAHEAGVPERAPQSSRSGKAAKDADTIALEKRVSDALGLKVSVDHKNPGGVMHIQYRDLEQLDDVLNRLERGR